MAIDAMHTDIHVDRRHLHRLLPLLRIVVSDNIAFGVEQIAFAIALVNSAEVPTVTVIVGELRILQLRV